MTVMWILFAFASALFASLTSILAKCGIGKTDSTVATAIRTTVVLIMAVIMSGVSGSLGSIADIDAKTWIFLTLSGLATGASWLCYFRALQTGDINKVVPIDKSSIILTLILAFIFLDDKITPLKGVCIVLIGAGTFLMIEKKTETDSGGKNNKRPSWIIYAVLSAAFASLTSILGKIGIDGVESNLGTAIRTAVVLVMAWVTVFVTKKSGEIKKAPKNELLFVCLSGLATGASWLCYYKALQDGSAAAVAATDKLSILGTIAFSRIVFKEKLTVKSAVGLALITAGTMLMLIE